MPPPPRLASLDALRGLGAIAIALAHLQSAFRPDWNEVGAFRDGPVAFVLGRCGLLGLSFFFVLSGFVLSRSFLHAGRPGALAAAAARRYPRLALPALAATLAAHALLANGLMPTPAAAADVAAANPVTAGPASYLRIIYAAGPSLGYAVREPLWAMFFAFDPARTHNTCLWTMPAELQSSFLVFACLGVFGRGRLLAAAGAVVAAVVFVHGALFIALAVVGMGLAAAHRATPARLPLPAGLALAAGAVWLGCDLRSYVGYEAVMPLTGLSYRGSRLAPAAAAVGLLAAAAFSPGLDRLLSLRPLAFLGRIAFCVYLIHIPLIASGGCGLLVALRAAGWSFDAAFAAVAAAYLPAVVAAAWVLHEVAERPAVWLGGVIDRAVSGPRPAVQPQSTRRPVRRAAPVGGAGRVAVRGS